jgi:hypothetical protein
MFNRECNSFGRHMKREARQDQWNVKLPPQKDHDFLGLIMDASPPPPFRPHFNTRQSVFSNMIIERSHLMFVIVRANLGLVAAPSKGVQFLNDNIEWSF